MSPASFPSPSAPRRTSRTLRGLLAGVLAAGAGLGGVLATVPPAQAAPPLVCTDSSVYLIQGTGEVRRVTATTGETTASVFDGNPANSGSGNQLGIGNAGVGAYNTTGAKVVEYDAASNGVTETADKLTAANVSGIAGAVNPATGIYYYGGYTSSASPMQLFAYDPTSNTTFGPVASIGVTAPAGGNGDIAFDSDGRLYLVASGGSGANLYVTDVDLPTTAAQSAVSATAEKISDIVATTTFNGIAFASDGYLYLGTTNSVAQVNPITGAVLGTRTFSGGVTGSTDLASCAFPSTLKIQKSFPDGRLTAGDQVTLGVDGDDYDGSPAGRTGTTAGGESGVQDQARTEYAGPAVVLPGRTYDFRETATGGTDLSRYVSTYQCVDTANGNRVLASGGGTNGYDFRTGTVTIPAVTTGSAVVCTISNAAPNPAVTLDKTVDRASITAANQTLTYSFAVRNDGNLPLANLRVTDPMSGLSAVTCAPVAQGATLAAGASTTCSATYTTTQADLDGGTPVTNTATATGTPPAVYALPDESGTDSVSTPVAADPAVALDKTASPSSASRVGQVVTYTFSVRNTGNQTLRDVAVSDPLPGLTALTCAPSTPATLAPGATVSCSATYTVTASDVATSRTIQNTATVEASTPADGLLSGTDTVDVPVASIPPVATDDSAATTFGTPVTLAGATNDTPGEAGGAAVVPAQTVFTSAATTDGGKTLVTPQGTWTVNPDGTIGFTPAAGYSGTTPPVEYRITDEAGKTDTANLAVTVRPGPLATGDEASTPQNVTVQVSPLGNDTPGRNADGSAGTMDVTSVLFPSAGQPAGATVSDGGRTLTVPGEGVYTANPTTGVVSFDPEPAFTGGASPVTYTAQDTVTGPGGATVHNPVTATITITVTPVRPVATDDATTTPFDTPVTLRGATNDTAGAASAPIVPGATVFPTGGQPAGSALSDAGKTLTVPGEGVWRVNPDGTVTFSPAAGFTGPSSQVAYRIEDANGTQDTATLDVTVRTGPAPTADTATTPQNVTVQVSPLGNDTPGRNADGSAGTMDATSVLFPSAGQPAGATVSDGGRTLTVPGEGVYTANPTTGVVSFDPEPAFTGPASPVTYAAQDTVLDVQGTPVHNPVSSTLTVTVTPITPVATDDTARTTAGRPVTLAGATNDTEGAASAPIAAGSTVFPTGGQPAGAVVSDAGKTLTFAGEGTYRIQADGSVVFTPEVAFAGTTTPVTYRIVDANGTADTATLQVLVGAGVLMAPDSGTTPQNVDVTVGVVDNDTPGENADGTAGSFDRTTVVFPSAGQPAGATVSDGGRTLTVPGEGVHTVDPTTGVVTFDPEPAFIGAASVVTYAVDEVVLDGDGQEVRTARTSTLAITVTPIIPTATNDSARTPFGTPVTLPATTNDSAGATSAPLVPADTVFPTGGQPSGAVVSDSGKTLTVPTQGVYEIQVDGSVLFTPATGFSGTTTAVTYRIADANGTTDTATLTVTVATGPSAAPDTASTPQDVTVTLDPLAGGAGGVGADTPGDNADGTPGTLDVTSVRFPTTGQPSGAVVSEDGLSVVVPGEGTYTVDPDTGRVTFDPVPAFRGVASPVRYTARDTVLDADGQEVHNTLGSTITITVTGIDPVANDDSASTPYATPVTLPAVFDDAAGADSAPLVPGATVFTAGQVASLPAGSTLSEDGRTLTVAGEGVWTIGGNGSATFTPADGFSGPTMPVEYRIEDTNGTTDTAELVVLVQPGPTATPDRTTTPQNVPVTLDPLGNDTPGSAADGSPGSWDRTSVTFPATGQPEGSTVSEDGRTLTVPGEGVWTAGTDGRVTFTPEPAFTGLASMVTYRVLDGHGNPATSTITVDVGAVNPTAADDRASTPFGTPVRIPVLSNDRAGSSDAPLVPSSVRLLPDGLPRGSTVSEDGKSATVPGQGTFTIGDDGVVTFTPEKGFTGTVAPIRYSVQDENGTTVRATVRVEVGPAGVVAPNEVTAPAGGGPVTVDVLANDTPSDGEQWVASSVCLVPGGTCLTRYTREGVGTWVVNPDGTITFTPVNGYSGTATIPYSVTDTAGNVYTTTLTITVPGGSLAQTGSELAPFLLTGFGALLAGLVLVVASRRRRQGVVTG